MGLLDKFRTGLQKSQDKLVQELRKIVSPRLTEDDFDRLEAALIGSDLGLETSTEIITEIRAAYETQGAAGLDIVEVARRRVEQALAAPAITLNRQLGALTVISIVGVNGTGKTTTAAKLAFQIQQSGRAVMLAACDTFRAAAIEQLKLWGERLGVPVISGNYGADPSAVAHDAISAALSKKSDYLLVDTAGRLHTKQNLMQELQKLHRVIGKKIMGAPHETLLVLDATTGMNAMNQAREFHKAVPLTGLVVTKLDGTSKGGMVVAIQRDVGVPIKFIGVGEQPDDLQPFDSFAFVSALLGQKA